MLRRNEVTCESAQYAGNACMEYFVILLLFYFSDSISGVKGSSGPLAFALVSSLY